MKRGYILAFLSLLSLNFVSALGGYSSFGFSGLFSEFNIEMYLNALLFVTIFAVIFFILKKSPFRENTVVCWIISLCVSAFGMYGILSTGFSFQNLVQTFGISSDLLTTILWMIGITVLVFLFLKFKFRKTFTILFSLAGVLLILLSFFNVLYEKAAGIAIGVGFLIIALFLYKRGPGKAYRYGKSIGRGIGKTSNFLYDHRPSGMFLRKEKKIAHKIRKLERRYQIAMNRKDFKEAKDLKDQIEYLEIRLKRFSP